MVLGLADVNFQEKLYGKRIFMNFRVQFVKHSQHSYYLNSILSIFFLESLIDMIFNVELGLGHRLAREVGEWGEDLPKTAGG